MSGMRRGAVCSCLLSGIMAISAVAAESEPPKEKPVVRTEEDIEQGKRNVRSVLNELEELFDADRSLPQVVATQNRSNRLTSK